MSFASLVFGNGQTTVGAIPLDVLQSETNDWDNTVSDYPVEEGAPITDNIVRTPERLTLNGTITAAGILAFQGGGQSKLIAAKDQFYDLYQNGALVSVITGLGHYEDMALSRLSINRDSSGIKLSVNCTLQHIRKVKLREVPLPPEQVSPAVNAQGEKLDKGHGAKGKVGQTGTDGGKVSDQNKDLLGNDSFRQDLVNVVSDILDVGQNVQDNL